MEWGDARREVSLVNRGAETEKISEYLDEDEEILYAARQRRLVPGGSPVTPNTIFATSKKLIIRSPLMLGLREHVEYFHYNDIVTINYEHGCFSSSLVLTAPGMGTTARPAKGSGQPRTESGTIGGMPKADVIKIAGIIRERTAKRRQKR